MFALAAPWTSKLPTFRLAALRIAVVTFCAIFGAGMLVTPRRFLSMGNSPLAPFAWLWGVAFVLATVALIVAGAGFLRKPWLIAIHLTCGLLFMAMAFVLSSDAVAPSSGLIVSLGIGVILMPILPHHNGTTAHRSCSLFALVLAVGLVGTGSIYALTRPTLFQGYALIGAGIVLFLAETVLKRFQWVWVSLYVLTATIIAGFLLLVLLSIASWTGLTLYGVLAVVTLILPVVGHRWSLVNPSSLRVRLALGLAVLSALPLLAALVTISNVSESTAYDQALTAQRSLASHVADNTELYVDQYLITMLTAADVLAKMSPAEQAAALGGLRATDVSAFAIYGPDGVGLARSDAQDYDPIPGSDVAEITASGQPKQVIRFFDDNRTAFEYIAPMVNDDGALVGFVSAIVPGRRTSESLATASSAASVNTLVWLIDSHRTIIAGPTNALPDRIDFDSFATDATARVGALSSYDGKDLHLVSYAPVSKYGWVAVADYQADTLLDGIDTARSTAFGILLASAIIIGVLGASLASVFTRPLGDLARAAELMAVEDTSPELPRSQVVEIAELSEVFGAMRQQLIERTSERQRALQAAEEAAAVREEFLSVAAHELKTPVTALRGHAQLALMRLQRASVDMEQQKVVLQRIDGQTQRLSLLIEQLLDISRLERDSLQLDRAQVDMSALMRTAIGVDWPVPAGSSRVQLILPDHPLIANVDALRVEQIVTNLVSNAVKFSPENTPIEVELTEDGVWVQLCVRDHGLGIPLDVRPRLFERFFQAHRDSHRSGLGLGLYITRQIVDKHGGTIEAQFPEDGGSRFVVRLPKSGVIIDAVETAPQPA